MPKLNNKTRLKLLTPIGYCVAVNALFVFVLDKLTVRHVIAWAITDMAFGLWIIARLQLGNAFSLAPKSKYLVTTGLYRKLRHPVYYFSILTVAGIGLFIWSSPVLIAVLALIALETYRIQKEEALLERSFGQEYLNYKRTTWL